MRATQLRALAEMAGALSRLALAALEDGDTDPGELLSELEAAKIAKCSIRILRDARRSGALTVYGRQRSRTIKRADLDVWIESRRVPVMAGPVDDDLERRIRRKARARRRGSR